MAVWDLAHIWRRPLVFLVRGFCACLLALLYLLISLALFSGDRTARTAPSSHPQASLGREHAGPSLLSSTSEDKPSVAPETAHLDPDAPFNTNHHSCFTGGRPPVARSQEDARSLVIPKIVVQDFSAEDGSFRCKAPDYDLTDSLKRRRRPSWTRVPATLEDYLAVTTRPSSFRPLHTVGVPSVEGLRPLFLANGLKHRRPDVLVQAGRERMLRDVIAKDGSFVIVGL
jgi:hypothetical protein